MGFRRCRQHLFGCGDARLVPLSIEIERSFSKAQEHTHLSRPAMAILAVYQNIKQQPIHSLQHPNIHLRHKTLFVMFSMNTIDPSYLAVSSIFSAQLCLPLLLLNMNVDLFVVLALQRCADLFFEIRARAVISVVKKTTCGR